MFISIYINKIYLIISVKVCVSASAATAALRRLHENHLKQSVLKRVWNMAHLCSSIAASWIQKPKQCLVVEMICLPDKLLKKVLSAQWIFIRKNATSRSKQNPSNLTNFTRYLPYLPPEKWHVPKKGTINFKRKFPSNHWFSGIILVFGGAFLQPGAQ